MLEVNNREKERERVRRSKREREREIEGWRETQRGKGKK